MVQSVFHLTDPSGWSAAQRDRQVVPVSLHSEGFVHCSTTDQLVGTIERHFAGVDALVLLELGDSARPDLVWEEGRPGEVYPHLYRPIEISEVTRAVPWRRSSDGSVALPPELDPSPGRP
jgi:uncharacterized protein (DUF952 family)